MTAVAAAGVPIRPLIDGLQYCRWSRRIFEEMRQAGLTAVHATVSYHGGFRQCVELLADWNRRFRDHADLIVPGRSGADLDGAAATGRTAIVLGLQNPLPVEDDLGLVQVLHALGIRVMQLTYNVQSLLGSGWQEPTDGGLTRMGALVVAEMNRLGMLVDLSHAGERTALEAIACSARPVTVSHANPIWWRNTRRNVSRPLCVALAAGNGLLGLSLYPHHLPEGPDTTLARFCAMAADAASILGVDRIGIGSDLCQDQPDDVVRWMREGRWLPPDPTPVAFPPQPAFFRSALDLPRLAEGLLAHGFSEAEAGKVLGGNWLRFMRDAFQPGPEQHP